MRTAALRKISSYGREPDRETESLERSLTAKLRQDGLNSFGPFIVTGLKTATYAAKPWEFVRGDPTAATFTVFLPDANASDSGTIVVANDSASTNGITVQPLNTTCTINGTTSASISLARGALTLQPDAASNNWIVASAASVGTVSLAGDVTGTTAASTVAKIQGRSVSSSAPAIYQVLASLDGSTWAPAYSTQPIASSVLTFSTSAGTADTTVFTVPASPSGTNRLTLVFVEIRLSTAITGGGTVVLRAGTSTGGNDLLVDSSSWTSATAAGTVYGNSIADLGTAHTAAHRYWAFLDAGATIKVRATTGGGGISGGAATCYVYGAFAP